jgi:cellulose biosynthesis protein BcsQ
MRLFTEQHLFAKIDKGSARLRNDINIFRNEYDYIFIDCPTN